MATCAVQDLLDDANCFFPAASGERGQAIELTLLCKILQALDPMAACSVQDLLDDSACFLSVAGSDRGKAIMLQLLCEILNSLGGGSSGVFLCGDGSPEGVQIGAMCGQTYVDRLTGDLYKFLGTPGTNTGWV